MWTINKEFDLCYGHRVWSQKLNPAYSNASQCKCRHLHGHEGKIRVYLEGDALELGMVTDFTHLAWFKTFIDKTIDHKFIIDANDPMFEATIRPHGFDDFMMFKDVSVKLGGIEYVVGQAINLEAMKVEPGTPAYEYLESFFIVDFTPTSEELARWAFTVVNTFMAPFAKTSKVEWWETPRSCATYMAPTTPDFETIRLLAAKAGLDTEDDDVPAENLREP